MMAGIPLVNLARQYERLAPELDRAIHETCARADFILGQAVATFETAFAAYLGVRHCIGVASGADALHLILRGLGIGAGDEVILPANTFIATAQAVWYAGATPVLVDCDERTATIDVSAVSAAVTNRTRAIMPVHLYGQPADVDPLLALASERGLHVVEDAAQAHGAAYRGKKVRDARRRRRIQLLSGEEPRRLRGRWRRHHERRWTGSGDSIAAEPGIHGEIRPSAHGIQLEARHDSGRGAERQAAASRRLERPAHRRSPTATAQRWPGIPRACASSIARTGRAATRITCSSCGRSTAGGMASFASCRRVESASRFTTRLPSTSRKPSSRCSQAPRRFPVAERLASEVFSLPLCPDMTDGEAQTVLDSSTRCCRPSLRRSGGDDDSRLSDRAARGHTGQLSGDSRDPRRTPARAPGPADGSSEGSGRGHVLGGLRTDRAVRRGLLSERAVASRRFRGRVASGSPSGPRAAVLPDADAAHVVAGRARPIVLSMALRHSRHRGTAPAGAVSSPR